MIGSSPEHGEHTCCIDGAGQRGGSSRKHGEHRLCNAEELVVVRFIPATRGTGSLTMLGVYGNGSSPQSRGTYAPRTVRGVVLVGPEK